jgi:hypothetical protein
MESLNLAHVHLLLNHLPTIGFGIALGLFVVAVIGKNDSLKKTGLVLFFLVAVMAIPTYMTGSAAERILCPEAKCPEGISLRMIHAHEDWALLAFVVMEITGFFAWLALWQLRRKMVVALWNWTVVLLLSLIAFGLMAQAASEGGEIRHIEIRGAGDSAPAPAQATGPDGAQATAPDGIARAIGAMVAGNTGLGWIWPACETIHFVGLCMLFLVVLLVDLRILGIAKGLSFAALFQLLPLGMLGFVLNLGTGLLFFLAAPGQYVNNVEFHRKVIFIVLAGINVLYFMLVDDAWKVGPEDEAPLRAKVVAASAIFLWVGILYYGHMLPFLGNSF